nr:MAG TPA: hypothetical protein [Bacteriophage sp.]
MNKALFKFFMFKNFRKFARFNDTIYSVIA